MSETKIKMDWVNGLPRMTFMDEPQIRDAFIEANVKVRGVSPAGASTFYEKEAMYLKRVIYASTSTSSDLRNATTFSLYACFMDMAIYGNILSFNPDDHLVYVTQRGYKTGRDENGQDVYENRARMEISPYGELALRMDCGQVKYADPAVVVRDGDSWDLGTDDRGNVVSVWKSKITGRASTKIIGSFIKVIRPDGSFITSYLLQEDIDRLVNYSKRQNRGKANALYGVGEGGTGIDAGFLKAKTLKHAFSTFPKVQLRGNNSQIEEEDYQDDPMEDAPPARQAPPSDYVAPGFEKEPEDFTPPQTQTKGIIVNRPVEEDTF